MRQTAKPPIFYMLPDDPKMQFCFLLYLKEIYAQFVETNVHVKHNIDNELKQTFMDLDLQITRKHPVVMHYIDRFRYPVNKFVKRFLIIYSGYSAL